MLHETLFWCIFIWKGVAMVIEACELGGDCTAREGRLGFTREFPPDHQVSTISTSDQILRNVFKSGRNAIKVVKLTCVCHRHVAGGRHWEPDRTCSLEKSRRPVGTFWTTCNQFLFTSLRWHVDRIWIYCLFKHFLWKYLCLTVSKTRVWKQPSIHSNIPHPWWFHTSSTPLLPFPSCLWIWSIYGLDFFPTFALGKPPKKLVIFRKFS